MSKLKTTLKVTGVTLFLALAAFLIVFSLPASGWKALSVQTGSMTPAIPAGSLVFVHSVPTTSLNVGDVITYKSKESAGQTITHRITHIQTENRAIPEITVKGDANKQADQPFPATQVVGNVTAAVPYAGKALDFVKSPLGLVLLVYVPALLIFIYEIQLLVKRLAKYEASRQAQPVPVAIEEPMDMPVEEPAEELEEPSPAPPRPEPAKRTRPRIIDGLSVLLVAALLVTTAGVTKAALNSTATLTGNTIAATAPVTPKVLIWRVNLPGAPGVDTSFQPIIYLYNPVRGTVPDIEGWRLESSSGLVFGFRGPTPLYPRNRFFDVHAGPSGILHPSGDYLVLKDKAGNIVDSLSWGTNTSQLNPAIPSLTTKMDVLRNDPAIDTNTAADWHTQNESD
jgi:signal peptidase I